MESQDIAILLVVLVLLGVVAYVIYSNYVQPQTSSRETQTGEIEAPTPFNPLGKAGSFEILINPPKEEICGNFGPRVAF